MKGMAERFNVKDSLRTRIILKINASKEYNRSVIEKYIIMENIFQAWRLVYLNEYHK